MDFEELNKIGENWAAKSTGGDTGGNEENDLDPNDFNDVDSNNH